MLVKENTAPHAHFQMPRHAYALAPGEGLEAALARFTPAQLAYMREHNLIRVIERPATDAAGVQRAANAFAAWRQHARCQVHARTKLGTAFRPEDRVQGRRLLQQYRVARRMHLRLEQRRVHVLYRCFRVLCAPQRTARLLAARRALQRFWLAGQVHKRLARHALRAMCGPFRALDSLRRMAVWVPRLLAVWRQWVCGCARQRRANLLVAAAGSPLCLRRRGRSWTLPPGVRRQTPCVGGGLWAVMAHGTPT